MLKKIAAFFALAAALFAFPGEALASEAFVRSIAEQAEHFLYNQTDEELKQVAQTFCDPQGREMTRQEARDADHIVMYKQGEDNTGVIYLWPGNHNDGAVETVAFATRDKSLAFGGGVKVGDPISKALDSGIMEGQYFERSSGDGTATAHLWSTGPYTLSMFSIDGKITHVSYFSNYLLEKVTVRDDLTAYLKSPQPPRGAQPAAPQKTAVESAGGTNDTSSGVDVINSYPISQREKNNLSIQQRGAYNLYANKKYADAYAAFAKLADAYDCNYLSAYWAGAAAEKLKKNDEAREWYARAAGINPNYKPALDALAKMSGRPSAPPGGTNDKSIWDKYLR
jgi:hypothetical protein